MHWCWHLDEAIMMHVVASSHEYFDQPITPDAVEINIFLDIEPTLQTHNIL